MARGLLREGHGPFTPSSASLGSYCTGTLIGPRTVLTAAHCFEFGSSIVAASGAHQKRKTTVPISFPFVKAVTCPGDSGGPYFIAESNAIVATVKGDGMGLEWVGDAAQHHDWIMKHRAASERGELTID